MSRRPRTSTFVLMGLFLGVLALYVVVRPVPAGTAGTPAQPTQTASPSPSKTPSKTPTPTGQAAAPAATPSPSQPSP
jgi:hypothetical protein